MTKNNCNIIRIPLDYSENSSNSLSNSEKFEKQIDIGTANDNVKINKNEEKKNLEEGNDKAPKGERNEGINYGKSHDEEEKHENNLEGRQKDNFGPKKEKKVIYLKLLKIKKMLKQMIKMPITIKA